MKCKRCGHSLPETGFICPNCNTMMSIDQIKIQKENQKKENKPSLEMISEKYGFKKQIYEKREEQKFKFYPLLFGIGILFAIILFLFFVYL